MLPLLFVLLLLVKHFIADFPLQTAYMLRKVQPTGWKLPLLCHVLVHGALTGAVSLVFVSVTHALLFALLDAAVHFAVDTWKARFTHYQISQKGFWVSLGADQLFHHMTYVGIVALSLYLA